MSELEWHVSLTEEISVEQTIEQATVPTKELQQHGAHLNQKLNYTRK